MEKMVTMQAADLPNAVTRHWLVDHLRCQLPLASGAPLPRGIVATLPAGSAGMRVLFVKGHCG